MTLQSTDIVLTLSGGGSNISPNTSLGGNPSSQPITGVLNNLFDNISLDKAAIGLIDYRCFYIFNNNITDTLYTTKVYIESQVSQGAYVVLGYVRKTDIQRIKITGTPSGGNFVLNYISSVGIVPVTINYDASVSTWASSFQTALNGLSNLSGVVVSGSSGGGNIIFDVSFEGDDNYRFHELFELSANNLTGSGTISIAITKIADGAPVNAIAPSISSTISTPPGVTFADYNAGNPIAVGDLHPGDGVAIWVKRVTPVGTDAILSDGYSLKIKGLPVLPQGPPPVIGLPPLPPPECSIVGNFTWNSSTSSSSIYVRERLSGGVENTYIHYSSLGTLDLSALNDSDSVVFYATSDDVTIMVGETDSVTESFSSTSGPAIFTIPANYVIFRDTIGYMISNGTGTSSTQKTFQLSGSPAIHYTFAAGNSSNNGTGHVINMEVGGFATRNWTTGITKYELQDKGWMTGNILKFKFYHVVGGAGFANITGVTCNDG